jgi:hypothetical protein
MVVGAAAASERHYAMPAEEPYQQFVQLLEALVEARDRSREHVAAIESEFARHFDDDPRLVDLQYELAMYGADEHPGDAALVKECEWALKLLRATRRQA